MPPLRPQRGNYHDFASDCRLKCVRQDGKFLNGFNMIRAATSDFRKLRLTPPPNQWL
jgi:hypothetical protein